MTLAAPVTETLDGAATDLDGATTIVIVQAANTADESSGGLR